MESNIMNNAIKLAIEKGGYKNNDWLIRGKSIIHKTSHENLNYYQIILDPLFWRSLEKPLGLYAGEGKQKAMSYFECIMYGKRTDDFWDDLLNPNRE